MFFNKLLQQVAVLVVSSILLVVLVVEARSSGGSGNDIDGISVVDVTKDVLQLHNNLRRRHSAKALSVDIDASNNSIGRARTVAQQGKLEHERQSKYGENLAFSTDQNVSLEDLVLLWYNEKEDYDYNRPGFSQATGHFTQLVWKSTEGLGCALAITNDGPLPGSYLACNYSPVGNVEGQFEQNVKIEQ